MKKKKIDKRKQLTRWLCIALCALLAGGSIVSVLLYAFGVY